jgi:signal peptidase II
MTHSTLIKYTAIFLVLICGFIADFKTKQLVNIHFTGKPIHSIVPGFLEIGVVENRGMVFGILNSAEGKKNHFISAMTWVRLVLCIGIIVYVCINRKQNFLSLLPFILVWIGALGNLFDSFRLGHVIDFIHIHAGHILDWPFYFNLADAYICFGAGILIINGMLLPKQRRGTND